MSTSTRLPLSSAPSRLHGLAPEPAAARCATSPCLLSSRQLFGGGQEVQIAHGESVYRLRITSLGKLILTK